MSCCFSLLSAGHGWILILLLVCSRGSYAQSLETDYIRRDIRRGDTLFRRGLYDSAQQVFHRNIRRVLLKNRQDTAWINQLGEAYLLLGYLYTSMDLPDSNLYYCRAALQLGEKYHLPVMADNAHVFLGQQFYALGQHDSALVHYEAALEVYRKAGFTKPQPGLLSDIGNVYYRQQAYDRARQYYQKGLDQALASQNKAAVGWCENNLGLVCFSTRAYEDALFHYQQAHDAALQTGEIRTRANTLSNIGHVLLAQRRNQAAIDTLNHALDLMRDIPDPVMLYEIRTRLAQAYAAAGQHQQAFEHLRYAQEQEARTRKEVQQRRIQTIQAQAEIANRREANQLLRQHNRRLWLGLLGGGLFMVIAALAAAYFNLRRRARLRTIAHEMREMALKAEINRLEAEENQMRLALEQAEKERLEATIREMQAAVNALTESLISKNRLLQSLSEVTREAMPQAGAGNPGSEIAPKLNRLLSAIEADIRRALSGRETDAHLQQVEDRFALLLGGNQTGLTRRELRLATYIALGFSSREIADFVSVEPSSVDIARGRLRKKLGLPPEVKLQEWLQEQLQPTAHTT